MLRRLLLHYTKIKRLQGEYMDNQKLLKLNYFINKSYECFSFAEFLKLAILNLHELVMYDSGMFFCGISKDCSYFKPYVGGSIEEHYQKKSFTEREEYLSHGESNNVGNEAYVYKSIDYTHGIVLIADEPRSDFLASQKHFHIVCVRMVNKGKFLGEIYLHRGKDKPDFDDEDLFTLRLMQPHVSTAFSVIHTITAVKYLEIENQPGSVLGMCIFDNDMSLVGGNVTGIEMLKTVTVFGSSVLYHVKELCADILDEAKTEQGRKVVFNTSLLKTPKGDIQINIFLNDTQKTNNKVQYVTIMQYCDENQITADYKFKFTKREADIIDCLIQGKNNTQLAEALNISENTIKTHIKNIYKKTGANNRTELTYVLMLNIN